MDEKIIENEIALYPVLSDKLVYLASGFKNINLHGDMAWREFNKSSSNVLVMSAS